VHKWINF